MIGLPDTTTTRKHATVTLDAAAVITLAAVAGAKHVLDWLHGSYSAQPTAGSTVIVTINGVTVWQESVTAAGHFQFPFPGGLYNPANNQAMVITLSDPGGAIVGKVNIGYR